MAPEPPRQRLAQIATVIVVLFGLWLAVAGIRVGWSNMMAHALPTAPLLSYADQQKMTQDEYEQKYHPIRTMPDGQRLRVTNKGTLWSAWDLPMDGNHLGDCYVIGKHFWLWMLPVNSTTPRWVDP
jgi:hypothetical protein